jgi:hypothetical protein
MNNERLEKMTDLSLDDPRQMCIAEYGESALYSLYEHKKTGNIYYIIDIGYIEKDITHPVVIYTDYNEENGISWIRPMHEFFDGRFIQLNKETL